MIVIIRRRRRRRRRRRVEEELSFPLLFQCYFFFLSCFFSTKFVRDYVGIAIFTDNDPSLTMILPSRSMKTPRGDDSFKFFFLFLFLFFFHFFLPSPMDAGTLSRLRDIVRGSIAKEAFKTALFWADKIVSVSGTEHLLFWITLQHPRNPPSSSQMTPMMCTH